MQTLENSINALVPKKKDAFDQALAYAGHRDPKVVFRLGLQSPPDGLITQ
ncbi:hypothetical protein HY440_03450 [Candidatus Microgenomates bacterium]|nr:hypothetical protein [Candidatus Microgenomates bacterium]